MWRPKLTLRVTTVQPLTGKSALALLRLSLGHATNKSNACLTYCAKRSSLWSMQSNRLNMNNTSKIVTITGLTMSLVNVIAFGLTVESVSALIAFSLTGCIVLSQ